MTRLGFALLTALIGLLVSPVAAGPYHFTQVYSGTAGSSPWNRPTINDLGQVAYFRDLGGLEQVVLNNGGVETVLAENDPNSNLPGDIVRFLHISPLNNQGNVAHLSQRRGSPSVVLSAPGFSTSSAEYAVLRLSCLNDSDSVTFIGSPVGTGPESVFVWNGSELVTVAEKHGPFSFLGADLNNAGDVAFATGAGVFAGDGGPLTTIAAAQDLPSALDGSLTINDLGQVAFRAGGTIFVGDSTSLTTVADTSGPYLSLNAPMITDTGTVAFEAVLDAGGNGIFVGPDAVADRVIAAADTLNGFNVSSVSIGGINDAGQIVFLATAGPATGVYVATPIPVPEPSSFLLGVVGAAGLAIFGLRRCT